MNEPETVLVVCQCGYQMPRRPALSTKPLAIAGTTAILEGTMET